MNTTKIVFFFLIFGVFFLLSSSALAQAEPVLYFCERYGRNGEVGVSDRFIAGYFTVIVKCDFALELVDVSLQLDKYNDRNRKFEYYMNFDYTVEPELKLLHFSQNEQNDLKIEEPGFYRVSLLDDRDRTVASALIEIIRK
jgi:hypothetical protein